MRHSRVHFASWWISMSMVACVGVTEDVPTARAPEPAPPKVTERSTEGSAAGLDEATPASASPIPEGPSITAVRAYEKILLKPDTKAPPIGIFRAGQTVPLREAAPLTTGPLGMALGHCKGGWYAVKPRGFVCLGANSSLDPMDVRAVAAREVLPNVNDPLPFRVGIVVADSPIYGRVPTREEQRKKEKGLDKYLASLPTTAPQKEIDLSPAGKGPSKAFQGYVETETPPLETSDVAFESRKISIANEFDAEAGRGSSRLTWGSSPKTK